MFVATHTRKEGRDYKSENEVIKYRIGKIQEMCASGAHIKSVDQILNSDQHGTDWLLGRNVVQKKAKGKAMASTSGMEEIKQQLRIQMEEEMDAKMKQKFARFVKKLQ